MSYVFTHGTGTELDPYQVATAADLNGVRDYIYLTESSEDPVYYYFEQTADIDLSGYENWVPIGNYPDIFFGQYDGNGYHISNLTMNYSGDEVTAGLFGYTVECNLLNINISNATIVASGGAGEAGSHNAGVLVGIAADTNIIGCCAGGTISSNSALPYVGGLVGAFGAELPALFSRNSADVDITITAEVTAFGGGLIGVSSAQNIENCFSSGSLSAEGVHVYIGGLTSHLDTMISIYNSYSIGLVSGTLIGEGGELHSGGLVGQVFEGTVANSYYNSETSGQSDTDKGTPKTTAELKLQTTFTNWDFTNVWDIDEAVNDGYPSLLVVPTDDFTYGAGTVESPYQVWTLANLCNVRKYSSDHFIQMADINLEGYNWSSIGDADTSKFYGSYNGNGFTIIGINKPLFDTTENATLQKIGLVDVAIIDGTGTLANSCYGGLIEQCFSTGTINASYRKVGGLAGGIQNWMEDTISVKDCYTTCSVTNNSTTESTGAEYGTGGLFGGVGYTFSVYEMVRCYSCGAVTIAINDSLTNVGGLIGWFTNYQPPDISTCYYDSETSGYSDTGKGTPKTTAEMKAELTFLGWDFDTVWGIDPEINNGYPYLRVFESTETPAYTFAHGTGTEADPYQVWTADDLNGVRDYLTAHFIQMADIDLSEVENWEPIGYWNSNQNDYYSGWFSGVYDGNGFEINNISIIDGVVISGSIIVDGVTTEIIGPGLAIGLFGQIYNAEIKKVKLNNFLAAIEADPDSVAGVAIGGIASVASIASGTISECVVQGSISLSVTESQAENVVGSILVGGITTELEGNISNSYTLLDLSINSPIGCISYCAGVSTGLNTSNCYSVINNTSTNTIVLGIGGNASDTCYYDSDLLTADPEYAEFDGIPKTTAELKQQATFTNWDFTDVWGIDPEINNGYPYLRVFAGESGEEEPEEEQDPVVYLPITFRPYTGPGIKMTIINNMR